MIKSRDAGHVFLKESLKATHFISISSEHTRF